jgi:Tfp pilus tip-associated adhesin PilY1
LPGSRLAGCSSNDQPEPATPSTSSVGAPATSDSDPNAGVLNGTQLKAALLTKSDLPAKFKVQKDLVRDTAEVFGERSKATTPTKATCKELDTNVWIGGAGVGSASFAQTGYIDGFGNEIDAEIDAYRGTDAELVMANLKKLFTVCSSYKTKTPGVGTTTVKVAHKAGPEAGDESIKAVLTSPAWAGGSTLVAVRVGKTVVSVLYSSSKIKASAAAANHAATMAKRLEAA